MMRHNETNICIAVDAMNDLLRFLSDNDRAEALKRVSPTRTIDAKLIHDAIKRAQGNISLAARLVGCSRATMRSYMTELKLPLGKPGRKPRLVTSTKK
jgi:DNA-binding NtrC family response regulator